MLTTTKLQALKRNPGTEKKKRLADRDGLYVMIYPTGGISFRWDYWVGGRSGRRGTIVFGQFPQMSLSEAREALLQAKKDLSQGIDPAKKKSEAKQLFRSQGTLHQWWEHYIEHVELAESTLQMRTSIYNHDIKPILGKYKLSEIDEASVRAVIDKALERGARAIAIHIRGIIIQVYDWAICRGEQVVNPARNIKQRTIARILPRERYLDEESIAIFLSYFDIASGNIQLKASTKLLLLTFVRSSELAKATWDEVNFEKRLWTIPSERMKKRNPHIVPLSTQAFDILVALKSLAGTSRFIIPSWFNPQVPFNSKSFNKFIDKVCEVATKNGNPIGPFTPHDFRRTASTLLHEAGFNSDWIEKQLAHEQRGVRAVYNKAQYLEDRKKMMQAWADMIDGYVAKYSPPQPEN